MTNYKIELTGERVLLPKWVQELPVDSEASENLAEGYVTFELRGSYNEISELLDQMEKLILEDIPADMELFLQDRLCCFEKWYGYSRLYDYLGIYEEVERRVLKKRDAE